MSDAASEIMVARCGLVCSACGAFTRGRCEGCAGERHMFRCCPVRACTIERGYTTCADCTEFADLKGCRKLNSFISKIFRMIFRTNRIGNLVQIRAGGLDAFKDERRASGRK
jgi:hypothetical protein